MKRQENKIKAFALRKEGKSYGQIAELLQISKSTISLWFRNVVWSQDIKTQLIQESKEASRKRLSRLNGLRQENLQNHYLAAEREAIKEFADFKDNKLFITALSLYWGEGDKIFKNGIVRISNVDEKVLKIFNDFLQKICQVEIGRIKADILLYPDLDPDKCLKFWSKNIKISENRFFKSTTVTGKHKVNRLGNGVCIVSVHDKYLKKKVLVWLELFRNEF